MTRAQHFVSISGGKDSTAVACLAVERMDRRPDFRPRFLFADTGNEHPSTIEHVAYLESALGITIETVRADFSDRFEARRERILRDWLVERRQKMHTLSCREAQAADLKYAERVLFREACDCPVKVSPALPAQMVNRAADLMRPTGNPFLDMAMLHGRFPGSQTRFCTDELKLQPMEAIKDPIRMGNDGTAIVEWIGERAAESRARAAKPMLEIARCSFRAPAILYRPIHRWDAKAVFAIAKRHGLKPNPLYLQGMGRVGCMPCIMCGKDELQEIARRFPDQIERIGEWERIVGGVARQAYTDLLADETAPLVNAFLPTNRIAGPKGRRYRTIQHAVEWSRTGRGGRNFDLLAVVSDAEHADVGPRCSSKYGLCE